MPRLGERSRDRARIGDAGGAEVDDDRCRGRVPGVAAISPQTAADLLAAGQRQEDDVGACRDFGDRGRATARRRRRSSLQAQPRSCRRRGPAPGACVTTLRHIGPPMTPRPMKPMVGAWSASSPQSINMPPLTSSVVPVIQFDAASTGTGWPGRCPRAGRSGRAAHCRWPTAARVGDILPHRRLDRSGRDDVGVDAMRRARPWRSISSGRAPRTWRDIGRARGDAADLRGDRSERDDLAVARARTSAGRAGAPG